MIVEAEGSGKDRDEALKNTFRDAVRKVVGAYVEEETVVKNDELIKDKVLILSSRNDSGESQEIARFKKMNLPVERDSFRRYLGGWFLLLVIRKVTIGFWQSRGAKNRAAVLA
ncbi:MAG: hypothetical protein ACLQNE_14550 [Thermoguttaceae bacterium]